MSAVQYLDPTSVAVNQSPEELLRLLFHESFLPSL